MKELKERRNSSNSSRERKGCFNGYGGVADLKILASLMLTYNHTIE